MTPDIPLPTLSLLHLSHPASHASFHQLTHSPAAHSPVAHVALYKLERNDITTLLRLPPRWNADIQTDIQTDWSEPDGGRGAVVVTR